MSKTLAVFGATGQQGGSVIKEVLRNPALYKQYNIRAIARNINSEKAIQLKEKVDVVQGDVLDKGSLEAALTGVHTAFIMTTPSFSADAVEVEFNIGKSVVDIAIKKGVEYIVFSTLPAVTEISSNKYTKVTPFDAKAKIEQYIRGLPIKSAFFAGGYFMENLETQPFLAPHKAADGTWVLSRHTSPKTPLPYIAVDDIGKFIGAILANPDKYEGKIFCGAAAIYTLEGLAAILSKATGKSIRYEQVSVDEFEKSLPFSGDTASIFVDIWNFQEDFGYFGPGTEKLVSWAIENVGDKLTTLEEYLEAHPLHLE